MISFLLNLNTGQFAKENVCVYCGKEQADILFCKGMAHYKCNINN